MRPVHLHLLRHADAGDPATWPGPDAERPLSAEGREQAMALAGHLVAIRFRCDAVITSPKRRAMETARPVADALGVEATVDDRLAGPLGLETVGAIFDAAGGPDAVILVGHDPDFSELLSHLVGADLSMKKGALARLDVRRPIHDGIATLRWLLPPDAIARR